MTLEVKAEPGESPRSLVRRFSRRVRRSGILRRAREIRFRQRPKSKRAKKEAALRRERIKREKAEMRKMGIGRL